MGFLFHQQEPSNPTKRCNYLTSTLKDAISNCKSCSRRCFSPSNTSEEDFTIEMDFIGDEQEIVSEIRTRSMEAKSRRQGCVMDSFFWVLPPEVNIPKAVVSENKYRDDEEKGEEVDLIDIGRDEFFSVASYFTHCSSKDEFVSVKTTFSSLTNGQFRPLVVEEYLRNGLDSFYFEDLRRRSMIQELWKCEGWPFGLCRKNLLLPPLPRSPSESWKWRSKSARMAKY